MKIKLEVSFRKSFKRLRKKYPSLPKDLQLLGENLQTNPTQGVALGMDCYKIRLSIGSKNLGTKLFCCAVTVTASETASAMSKLFFI